MKGRVLVCDDERAVRESYALLLSEEGMDVETAASGEDALGLLGQAPFDALLLDLRLPGISGLEALPQVLAIQPECMVLVMTAHASVDTAVEALKLGAFDYLSKPISFDDLKLKLERLLAHRSLVQQNRLLRRELAQGRSTTGGMLAMSPAMRKVADIVARVAGTRSRVLITGESGAGKEVVARALHDSSPWASGPFVAINMAAVPGDLVESQLFGHVRGAFTGASAAHEGLVRSAAGGTLLLDEIGDMSPGLQAKLLRLVDQGEFLPVGASRSMKLQARVLAATNRDLATEVQRGQFREDLFYRLSVVTISVPPLRSRVEDVAGLCDIMLERCRSQGMCKCGIDPAVMDVFRAHTWPGNVRELANVIERACCLGAGDVITLDDLPDDIAGLSPGTSQPSQDSLDLRAALSDVERSHIARVLKRAGGDRRQAANLLGIGLASLYRKIDKHGLG
ncbi:MAG: sigma-54-dependent Fis family transcriptional regulator [Oligoflexia bacterium]|nr:sigma-54-dependent Fis family transcriptional regulator [Oligoflexia bacterium]